MNKRSSRLANKRSRNGSRDNLTFEQKVSIQAMRNNKKENGKLS